jgi:hypothetical protein
MCFEEKHFPIQKTLIVSIDPCGAGVTITTKKSLKKDNYLSIRIPADLANEAGMFIWRMVDRCRPTEHSLTDSWSICENLVLIRDVNRGQV